MSNRFAATHSLTRPRQVVCHARLTPAAWWFLAIGLVLALARPGWGQDVSQREGIASTLRVAEGFRAERIYDVPTEQGSWVAIAVDPHGRLITSDQYGKLYRITVQDRNQPQVESIPLELGHAQGLLCAFDSLYVMSHGTGQNPPGLYRLRDTDADDQYDSVELLREIHGGGEHGPHAIRLSPDGRSLFVCAGNHTDLPEIDGSRLSPVWGEDQLIPRLPDARGHAVGRMAPGGWICKTDPEGKSFELVASGFRNEYDIAFDPNGELFTYDADMEWDIGLPWYRPTRVCHAISGAEFGWRNGTGKWPVDYPDSLPPAIEIGPGSPTGIEFGTGARFPARYQRSLFIADWSYGIIYAVRLEPEGSSFRGTAELFCTAPALPVTDLLIHPGDGAMYFLVGGRRTRSALYRVTYEGDQSTEPVTWPPPTDDARLRRELEAYHTESADAAAVAQTIWPALHHPDRFVRYAARVALEKVPVDQWRARADGETDPQRVLELAMALARVGDASLQQTAIDWLQRLAWSRLSSDQRLHLLRDYGLVLIRMGDPTPETLQAARSLMAHYPDDEPRVNRELARLLCFVQADGVVARTIDLLERSPTQQDQIHFALCLHAVKNGWDLKLRQRYFEWFLTAARLQGGNSFAPYLQNIRQAAIRQLTGEERAALAEVLKRQPETVDPYADLKARSFVRKWTSDDLLEQGEPDWSNCDIANGKRVFAAAQCYKCHRIRGQGGNVGPDLTNAGRRFNTRDLLETVIDPSKEVSDQYQATVFQLVNGQTVMGRIVNLNGNQYLVQTDMMQPGLLRSLSVDEIEEMRPARESMMPGGLLDTFTAEEIIDLLAYLRSTGQAAIDGAK